MLVVDHLVGKIQKQYFDTFLDASVIARDANYGLYGDNATQSIVDIIATMDEAETAYKNCLHAVETLKHYQIIT